MMNMDVMRRLVAEAATGDRSMPTAHAALAHWDFDAGTLRPFRYSANSIYTFEQHGVTRILRLAVAGDGVRARDARTRSGKSSLRSAMDGKTPRAIRELV